jgi:hypothetical protein
MVPAIDIGAGRAHYAYGRLRQRLRSVPARPRPYVDGGVGMMDGYLPTLKTIRNIIHKDL